MLERRAALETAARQREQAVLRGLIDDAWRDLPGVLAASWEKLATRRDWCQAACAVARRTLTGGGPLAAEVDEGLAFAGESQDLQEMLGNLLDNACKAARTRVLVGAQQSGRWLQLSVDDDGPGIPEAQMSEALKRGRRLDEATPGSGLGLAIVQELALLYGGALELRRSRLGGLLVVLTLPAA